MQARVSRWLPELKLCGVIGAGTTLHGLRVSYAAWRKRNGATDAEVAARRSLAADGHPLHRHVSREDNVVCAFKRLKNET
jgi:hypothetical protein